MLYAKNVFVILILFCKANFTKTVSGATEVEVNGNFYDIQGVDALVGFISGICAANYDVTDILVDSTLKIIGSDMNVFEGFAEKMDTLSNKTDTKITLLVSADAADLPEAIAKFAESV